MNGVLKLLCWVPSGYAVLGKQTGIAKFGCFIMPLRQVYWSLHKKANSRTALKNVKNALTQFFSLILCYGAMVLMENWTPCMAKLKKLASHSVLRWTSTKQNHKPWTTPAWKLIPYWFKITIDKNSSHWSMNFQCPACCIASLDVNLLLVMKFKKQV